MLWSRPHIILIKDNKQAYIGYDKYFKTVFDTTLIFSNDSFEELAKTYSITKACKHDKLYLNLI
jgi:hypothetical protein